ncbi:hypothetical protein F941_02681 [Acinetobacter bouvetii DSM 14964 = CIP 107468]|uniref:Uncharacterized protein n=1 Tax=Acinetobacter bouvetii DSM 14964 = CIP 107468 TaxID=1120925 RepID=N9DN01_9GAMM|nr:hypothetical protein F941_02681 [Acinetobacter bouvetii DSM 14964 = CIP 107468]
MPLIRTHFKYTACTGLIMYQKIVELFIHSLIEK